MVEARFEIACVIFGIRVGWFLLPTYLTFMIYLMAVLLIFEFCGKLADISKATAGFILGGAVFTQGMVHLDNL